MQFSSSGMFHIELLNSIVWVGEVILELDVWAKIFVLIAFIRI